MKTQILALHLQEVRLFIPRFHLSLIGELFVSKGEAELNNPAISAAGAIFFLRDVKKVEGNKITLE